MNWFLAKVQVLVFRKVTKNVQVCNQIPVYNRFAPLSIDDQTPSIGSNDDTQASVGDLVVPYKDTKIVGT